MDWLSKQFRSSDDGNDGVLSVDDFAWCLRNQIGLEEEHTNSITKYAVGICTPEESQPIVRYKFLLRYLE